MPTLNKPTDNLSKDKRAKIIKRKKDAFEGSLLSRVLTSATFAEKVEAIREVNPYFYLLTTPKEKHED
jgi:hypothetical protein